MSNRLSKSYFPFLMKIMLPCLIISVSTAIIVSFFAMRLMDKTSEFSNNSVHLAIKSTQTNIDSVKNAAYFFAAQPEISEILTNDSPVYTDYVQSLIGNIKISNLDIINAYIFDQNAKTVCTADGVFSADEYFSRIFLYSRYPSNYWNTLRFYSTEPYRVLSPCVITAMQKKHNAIPIVFRRIGDMSQRRFLIFNIELSSLIPISTITANEKSEFYIFDKYTTDVFPLRDEYDTSKFADKNFIDKIVVSPNSNFQYKLGGKKYFVTTSSENDSIIGYTYIVLTDKNSVFDNLLPFIVGLAIFALLSMIISAILSVRSSKNIFRPIMKVYKNLSDTPSAASENLLHDIESLSALSKEKSNKLSEIMPYSQQNYLINYLNNPDLYSMYDTDIKTFIESSFNFKYDYFMVILLQLSPTSKFRECFSNDDYDVIRTGFYDVVYSFFAEKFVAFALPAQDKVLNIVLNLDEQDTDADIREILMNITECLKNDLEYITFSVGVSNKHKHIEGLRQSHKEALDNFVSYDTPSDSAVIEVNSKRDILFSNKSEIELMSALSTFDIERINDTMDKIFSSNQNISGKNIRILYNYILNTMLKFIHINNISYMDDLMDYEIVNKILNQPLGKIRSEISNLCKCIVSAKKKSTSFDDIYDYIKNKFDDPSLDMLSLSDAFNISQSTVAMHIKKNTGLSFKEVLANIRIENAKTLLKTTDLPIEKIWNLSGFSNERTFFRVFKSKVGMTPNQYKKL